MFDGFVLTLWMSEEKFEDCNALLSVETRSMFLANVRACSRVRVSGSSKSLSLIFSPEHPTTNLSKINSWTMQSGNWHYASRPPRAVTYCSVFSSGCSLRELMFARASILLGPGANFFRVVRLSLLELFSSEHI